MFAVTRTSWQAEGACVGIDKPDIFHDDEDDAAQAEAKAICAICPVWQECLSYAMVNPDLTGIWGCYSEGERYSARIGHRQLLGPAFCDWCDSAFIPTRVGMRFCGDRCRKAHHKVEKNANIQQPA
ncbi:WhiB [Mycobacterium phage Gaia]|uniref:WhiB n=1 Tax=Mycobacterium phage Gaia TaxID=1486472 RepID=A0A068F4L8_9CAUD|nr:WhiB [Mycobacterium phage Gaia]AID58891.1 WhiB [Mycobacterium phage Gaia]AYR00011.1 WhiB family transcription factor [Mycobacterium phage Nebkiss]